MLRFRAVIVLYKRLLAESDTFRTLTSALDHGGVAPDAFELIVYDNGPEPQSLPAWRWPIRYHHDPSNGGLVPAYNVALECCREAAVEWLLLLDQDTRLPADYVVTFRDAVQWVESRTAALVPKVRTAGGVTLPIPTFFGVTGYLDPLSDFVGLHDSGLATINSGSFVRAPFVLSRGGYPATYSLDAVDSWLFAQVYRAGGNVFVMPALIDHEISVEHVHGVNLDRWRSIVDAEVRFHLDMHGAAGRLFGALSLFRRSIHLRFGERAPKHAALTIRAAAILARRAFGRPESRPSVR
jgi:hypothetical protein